jgi:hypothetical protein
MGRAAVFLLYFYYTGLSVINMPLYVFQDE